MPRRTIATQLADVRQDIAGEIPLSVILQWFTSDRTSKLHQQILDPFIVTGTVVCSDSAGLSKLSQQRTLLEVMKLVHDPKEIIYGYGSHLGGTPIGIWAADNTEMFYPENIPVTDVAEHMIAAQIDNQQNLVQVGMGIHYGQFINIGGGLFGREADLIEEFAEDYTQGGDVALTRAAHTKLTQKLKTTSIKTFIEDLNLHAYKLPTTTKPVAVAKSKHSQYPIPFSVDFFNLLSRMSVTATDADYKFCQQFAKLSVVLLIKVKHPNKRFLLDQFAHWVLANAIIEKEVITHKLEQIKSNGSLGIFLNDDPESAINCARQIKSVLNSHHYEVSCGIAYGEVYVFSLPTGGKDIAGNPVNIASKLAEDVNTDGSIWIDQSVKLRKAPSQATAFTTPVSHITLSGWKLT
jgi:class 3 adenylate cyclase